MRNKMTAFVNILSCSKDENGWAPNPIIKSNLLDTERGRPDHRAADLRSGG